MRQKSLQANIAPQPPRQPPRLRTIYILAGFAAFMAIVLLFESYQGYSRPVPKWMTEAGRWYDDLFVSIIWGGVLVACLHYANYRRRLLKDGQEVLPRPWHQRHEVRLLLYPFVFFQFIELPIAIWKTAVALRDPATPGFAKSAWSLFPIEAAVSPVIGMAVIYYDRRRATREHRQHDNLCLVCGYDLRASTERCPECGASHTQATPAAT